MKRHLLAFWIVILLISTILICGAQTPRGRKEGGMEEIREPAVSGMFYPDRPEMLTRDIKRYLENVRQEKMDGEIIGLVSPHAGYLYSGQVAAYAYQLIDGKSFDTVVIVAPSHRVNFKGASLYHRGGISNSPGSRSGGCRVIKEAHGEMGRDPISS